MVVNSSAQQHYAHDVISTKPVIVHDKKFQANIKYVPLLKIKLERLIENSSKSISSNAALPLGYSSSLVDQINLHIGICRRLECTQCSNTRMCTTTYRYFYAAKSCDNVHIQYLCGTCTQSLKLGLALCEAYCTKFQQIL